MAVNTLEGIGQRQESAGYLDAWYTTSGVREIMRMQALLEVPRILAMNASIAFREQQGKFPTADELIASIDEYIYGNNHSADESQKSPHTVSPSERMRRSAIAGALENGQPIPQNLTSNALFADRVHPNYAEIHPILAPVDNINNRFELWMKPKRQKANEKIEEIKEKAREKIDRIERRLRR